MSGGRLLIGIEVLEFLRALRPKEQRILLQRFREIGSSPDRFMDFPERDSVGRDISVHICGRFAIKYWDDFADRHVKILDIHAVERRGG